MGILRTTKAYVLSRFHVFGSATFLGTAFYLDWFHIDADRCWAAKAIVPLTHLFTPETAHRIAVHAASIGFVPGSKSPLTRNTESLKQILWGREFDNPVGVGAGFDKNGETIPGLFNSGAGFIEIGTITPKAQYGNEKPRVFRLPKDKSVINRYGFNNEGLDAVERRLKHIVEGRIDEEGEMLGTSSNPGMGLKGRVGINLGKNKETVDAVDDYVRGIKRMTKYADYLVINVSSPNTPNLRQLQRREELTELLASVKQARDASVERMYNSPPILLKIAPDLDLSQMEDIASVALKYADGLIISNTTVARPPLLEIETAKETGGLSGPPLKDQSTRMYQLTQGRVPIIGCGGISNGRDAMEKIKAGASLVQVYTSMVYQGPQVITKIKREMMEQMQNEGYKNVSHAVGVDTMQLQRAKERAKEIKKPEEPKKEAFKRIADLVKR
ncbi:dihydroorotate dehydrogenase, mitochondrial [Planoprotostelium fungivorum]|uniref:Dihydroorotate dehydrogenase (quinone), mitochondrial n=1 Tax=Planoprotostelium fungivorum TaxID=1890364 RepID=A0A2P6NZE1_9EUKA|nr:dihydroorotate dehydrogenase, mitochondrial [Planoprotostelium fungivorum]